MYVVVVVYSMAGHWHHSRIMASVALPLAATNSTGDTVTDLHFNLILMVLVAIVVTL